MTIIGTPEAVTEAAINMAKVAIQLIDMRTHHGAHPRFGAVDVVPFTPVMGVTMDECVAIANAVGKAYGDMGIPVYLYEDACTKEARRNLASVRKGQYEGFFEKIKDPEWKPDYGPAVMNEKSGCSAVGARVPLVAFNVNLDCSDKARRYGVNVVGSEVIGTVPMKALLMAAEYYLQIENFNMDEILEKRLLELEE